VSVRVWSTCVPTDLKILDYVVANIFVDAV